MLPNQPSPLLTGLCLCQFADGVYLVLLMGLLEGYFVPLYNFFLTPENFEQKVKCGIPNATLESSCQPTEDVLSLFFCMLIGIHDFKVNVPGYVCCPFAELGTQGLQSLNRCTCAVVLLSAAWWTLCTE